jgi:hypothetical protein
MSSCLAEVEGRNGKSDSLAKAAFQPTAEKSLAPTEFGKEGSKEDKWRRTRAYGFHSTRFLRKLISFCLTLAAWLFMVEFLLQFVHTHDNRNSMSEQVQAITDKGQAPIERVVGFDLRYKFPGATVDFMPLLIFVGLLLLRNRTDFILLRVESCFKGPKRKAAPRYDSQSLEPHTLGLKGKPYLDVRKARGDDRAALSTKILSIYSD